MALTHPTCVTSDLLQTLHTQRVRETGLELSGDEAFAAAAPEPLNKLPLHLAGLFVVCFETSDSFHRLLTLCKKVLVSFLSDF